MKVRPLHDRVLVARIEEEERSRGGIIIPDTAKEKPIMGHVVSVGKGRVTKDGKVIPLEVKEGDKVLFSKYGGTDIALGERELLTLREDDILAVVESGLV